MLSRKEIGLLAALGLAVTVVVFPLGFFASRALWPTSSECDPVFDPEKPELLIPALRRLNAKQTGLFMTRTEIFKMNWCQANQTRCPNGEFPTEGPEADVVRDYSVAYDALTLSSVAPNETLAWKRCGTMSTLSAEPECDNDRCCPTRLSWHAMSGYKNTWDGVPCFLPSFKNAYQTISIGECCGSNAGCIVVNGRCCKLMQRPVILLCVPRGTSNLEFAVFYVDTYCSCQSVCI